MNRKERRAAEKAQPKKSDASSSRATRAETLKAQGMTLKAQGQDSEAAFALIESLKLDSSQADAHFSLAMMASTKPELNIDMNVINNSISDKRKLLNSYAVTMALMRQKRQYKEACICQQEICNLVPDDPLALMDLGVLYGLINKKEKAAITVSQALNMAPENRILKGVYSVVLSNATFSQFYPEVKKAVLLCLENLYDVHLRNFYAPWTNLMKVDPDLSAFTNAQVIPNAALFDIWADSLDADTGKFLSDPYFTMGLRRIIIAHGPSETVLTHLRRYICTNFDKLIETGRVNLFEDFLYALSEQCFFNEYVYGQTPEEESFIRTIQDRNDKLSICLISCYQPLHALMKDQLDILHKMADTDPRFANLIKVQVEDFFQEQVLKKKIPTFGSFANDISKAVQDQYEQHPYPRWSTICTTPLPNDDIILDSEKRNLPYNILVAGCGTGRHAIGTAARYPNSTVTAIDLSKASLAYGMRKAIECGLSERIKFVQADILSMSDWPDDFDIIECSGVLHHMQDPYKGWETLVSKLRKDGHMKIGLYSETARQPIVTAREFIKEHGYPSTDEGIRACRQAIFAMPTSNRMRQYLMDSGDFFSTSLVRDLIFHVQEHRLTLPQIKGMMEKLGLSCTRFLFTSADTVFQYDRQFPEDLKRNNFENLEKFENDNPLAFAGMYQFWCQKQR